MDVGPFTSMYNEHGELRQCYQADGVHDFMCKHSRKVKYGGIMSKIPNMTIGDVRQSFVQLRMLANSVSSTTVLWNGMTAGKFSILYIVKTHCNNKKVRPHPKKQNGASSMTPKPK